MTHSRITAQVMGEAQAAAAGRERLERSRAELQMAERQLGAIEHLSAWIVGPSKLEKNEHTRAHKLVEAAARSEILGAPEYIEACEAAGAIEAAQVFVVKHDWAAAIGPAIEESRTEINLPYPSCIFELVISGRAVLIWALQPEGGTPEVLFFTETPYGWWVAHEDYVAHGAPLGEAFQQMLAICIALDSQLATETVVHAPAALNKKRVRAGRPAVRDFHVVDLSRQNRRASTSTGTHRSPRLHFRRGHWRHTQEHRTWIRWTLVGNPDLGFVDKRYRL